MTARASLMLAAAGLILAAACTTTPGTEPIPTGVASPRPSPTSDAGRTITLADDGSAIVLYVGQHAELVQRDPLSPDPMVHGSAIDLVGLDNARAGGGREWEIRAVTAGTSTIRAEDGSQRFTIVVEVAE